MTYARRTDTTQSTIIQDLAKTGCHVQIIGMPVDLLVRRYWWPKNVWCLLEAKTPNRAGGRYAPRKDQETQAQFCRDHEVPYTTSSQAALAYLAQFESRLGLAHHEKT